MNYQNRKGIIILFVAIFSLSLLNGCGKETADNKKEEENTSTTYENGITTDQIRSLEGEDLNGNAVDSTIFSNYDLTMINIWATWCGPCVEELPALASLYKNLPENVNLITICSDGSEAKSNAKSILNESGAKFITICGDKTIQETILKNVSAIPTTIFVDKKGNVIGQPLLGAATEKDYANEIDARLKNIVD